MKLKNLLIKLLSFKSSIIAKVWIGLISLFILLKVIIPGWNNISRTDFNNYYAASLLLAKGESIHKYYDNDWFTQKAKTNGVESGAKFSPFPPLTAYALYPLTYFKLLTAKRIWLVLNIILLLYIPFRIKKMTDWSLINSTLFLSLFIIPISSSMNLGQVYFILGYLLLELFGQFHFKNKYQSWLLGFSIGIITSLKYFPILFLGYLIKSPKKYYILFWTIFTIITSNLIVYIWDSQAYHVFLEHFISHTQGNLPGQGEYAVAFQSIDSILNNLFVYDQIRNPNPSLNYPILKPIIKYSLFGVIFGLIFNLIRKNHYQINSNIVSIGIIGMFVIIPASASYHFLLLLWPILCLMKWIASFKSKKTLIFISILIFVTFTIHHDYIPNFNSFPVINLLTHYPRFWGVLCVFLALNLYHTNYPTKNYG